MSTEEFIISVFCLVDDSLQKLLNGRKLRERGFSPHLSDSEVITMEIVGEFLGYDGDKQIWQYFKTCWTHFFLRIPDRTNFARQAANLYAVKQRMQKMFAEALMSPQDQLHIIDGLPMPVCKFARAYFSRVFKGEAAYGYCASKKEKYYGFRGHVVISSLGIITEATFAPANIDEREVCPELTEKLQGLLLGDKGFIRPSLTEELALRMLHLQTPLRDNMPDKRPRRFLKWLMTKRRLIETVIGQLSERFHIEKIRARDIWLSKSHAFGEKFWLTQCV